MAVHPRVLALLAGPGGSRLAGLEGAARRRFFLVPAAGNGHVHLDHFEVLAQGKLDTLRPEAPVEEGKTVELKLVEVGLHDPTAAVGKLDGGYEVVVAGAAKLVGKKVTATVGAVLEGAAFATIADGAPAATPITFEAEAEKPTRAPRGKKAAAVEPETEPETEIEPETETEETQVAEPEEAAAGEEPDAEVAPKKKRTRRGTRGGRGRKKPATTAASDGADEAAGGNGRPRPRIHVPAADLSAPEATAPEDVAGPAEDEAPPEDGQPARKRSRRGSRGGRKRRKPAAGDETTAPAGEGVAVAAVPDDDEPEYVPMSEWIDDFEARPRG